MQKLGAAVLARQSLSGAKWRGRIRKGAFAAVSTLLGLVPAESLAQPAASAAEVSVDFASSRGPMLHAERMNNFSAGSFTGQRSADVDFFNKEGLHGEIYRVWLRAQDIYDPATGAYNYDHMTPYLTDASRMSDSLLAVMDTRVAIRDQKQTPDQIKPIIKTIMKDLKRKFPRIKYIEAFNEPDYNLAATIRPEQLYDYYKVYYEAVNEINRELKPAVPLQIGGPALMSFDEPWMAAFLDRYKADPSPDKRIDFISYHDYGEFPGGYHGQGGPRAYHFYKDDPSEIAGQRAQLEAMLSSHGLDPHTPSFVTEMGIYPGPSFDNPKDPHPDYLIGAAGVPSLQYWLLETPGSVPFNWVVRHGAEERKDQLVTRAGPGKPIPTGVFTPYGNAMLMMSKLKTERVVAHSDALAAGKGVYAIATKDKTGAAVMVWNYQHTDARSYRVTLDLDHLPGNLRNRPVRQRMFRIDDKTSNYWADPAHANLQQVSSKVVRPGADDKVTVELTPNALELVLLEPVGGDVK